jgi:hypothetical protein
MVSRVLLRVKSQTCVDLTRLSLNRLQRAVVDKNTSDHLIFPSHFFTTLSDEGTYAVRSWTARKHIDIFQKKLIFIPICQSLHWSLCVVVNPGAILNASNNEASPDDPLPCMIFLDSLKAHEKSRVQTHVMKWLNAEWIRLKKEEDETHTGIRFTKKTFPIFDPVGKLASCNQITLRLLLCGVFSYYFLSQSPTKTTDGTVEFSFVVMAIPCISFAIENSLTPKQDLTLPIWKLASAHLEALLLTAPNLSLIWKTLHAFARKLEH